MKKKFLSLLLALAMCLSLSVPAFAESTSAKSTAVYTYDTYSVYYDSDISTSWATLSAYLDSAESILDSKFDISLDRLYAVSSSALNQRDGCTRSVSLICNTNCGTLSSCKDLHHKSGNHFLYVSDAGNAKIFRFVNYIICRYNTSTLQHQTLVGMASNDDSDAMVSIRANSILWATVHELSHWYGAHDFQCVDGQECVMRYGSTVYNKWCDNCADDIEMYLLGY